jgi:hypothetical protein
MPLNKNWPTWYSNGSEIELLCKPSGIKTDRTMQNMTYLAAQYLAAAGISFLGLKKDDSHTNLGFVSWGCLAA